MSKTIEVIAMKTGFHGHLREPGDRFQVSADEELGDWMRATDSNGLPKDTKAEIKANKDDGAPLPSAPFTPAAEVYKVKHNGGGNFIVIDAGGTQVGNVFEKDKADNTKAKLAAQAEADRMNRGGVATSPISPIAAAAAPQVAEPAAPVADANLPDA